MMTYSAQNRLRATSRLSGITGYSWHGRDESIRREGVTVEMGTETVAVVYAEMHADEFGRGTLELDLTATPSALGAAMRDFVARGMTGWTAGPFSLSVDAKTASIDPTAFVITAGGHDNGGVSLMLGGDIARLREALLGVLMP